MEEEGVTRAELAERIGTSRSHITQLLSGSRNLTVHTLSDLAFLLGHKIRLDYLPLSGAQAFARPYVLSNPEKQKVLFGTLFPCPFEASSDQEDAETEVGLRYAA